MKLFSLVPLLALFVASCTMPSRVTSTSKLTEIYGPGVVQLPTVVDLDVSDQKVSHTISVRNDFSSNSLKNKAVSELIDSLEIDILVEPTYQIVEKGSLTEVTVRGYPAKYVDFRPAVYEDIVLIEAGVLQKAETVKSTTSEESTKKGKGRIFAFLGAIGVVALLLAAGV